MERMSSIFHWTSDPRRSFTSEFCRVILSVFPSLLSGIRAYEQLGYRAFGTPGKMAAGIAITLQNIGGETLPNTLASQETQCIVLWPCEGRYTITHTHTHTSTGDLKMDWCHSFLIYTLGHCSYLFFYFLSLMVPPIVQPLPPHPFYKVKDYRLFSRLMPHYNIIHIRLIVIYKSYKSKQNLTIFWGKIRMVLVKCIKMWNIDNIDKKAKQVKFINIAHFIHKHNCFL